MFVMDGFAPAPLRLTEELSGRPATVLAALAERARHTLATDTLYAHVAVHPAAHLLVAVFSVEPGALLAESVRRNYPAPEKLLWVSQQNDHTWAAVLLHDQAVLSESVALNAAELKQLLDDVDGTDLRVVSDCLSPQQLPADAQFHPQSPGIGTVSLREGLATVTVRPLDNVLRELGKTPATTRWVAAFLVVLVLGGAQWWRTLDDAVVTVPAAVLLSPAETARAQAQQVLASPAPRQVFERITAQVQALAALPGWQLASLTYEDGLLTLLLESPQAYWQGLIDYTTTTGMAYTVLDGHRAELTMALELMNRDVPDPLPAPTAHALHLVQALDAAGINLALTAPAPGSALGQWQLTLNLAHQGQALAVLAALITDGPACVERIHLANNRGRYSGRVELSIWETGDGVS